MSCVEFQDRMAELIGSGEDLSCASSPERLRRLPRPAGRFENHRRRGTAIVSQRGTAGRGVGTHRVGHQAGRRAGSRIDASRLFAFPSFFSPRRTKTMGHATPTFSAQSIVLPLRRWVACVRCLHARIDDRSSAVAFAREPLPLTFMDFWPIDRWDGWLELRPGDALVPVAYRDSDRVYTSRKPFK